MIDFNRDDRSMEMWCDTCSDCETFYGLFEECIIDAKEDGWLIRKYDNEWTHQCPACVEYENSVENDFKEK